MRTLAMLVLFGGCLGTYSAPSDPSPLTSADLGRVASPQTTSDLATAGDLAQAHDLAPAHDGGTGAMRDMTPPTGSDLATVAGSFGAPCAVAGDCQNGLCESFGGILLCSKACTMLGVLDPACPNNGMCNKMGYCRP